MERVNEGGDSVAEGEGVANDEAGQVLSLRPEEVSLADDFFARSHQASHDVVLRPNRSHPSPRLGLRLS